MEVALWPAGITDCRLLVEYQHGGGADGQL